MAVGTEVVAKVAEAPKPSIAERMKADLQAAEGGTETDAVAEVESADVEPDTTETEKSAIASDDTEKDDDSETAEAAAEKTKPNRYQRQRAKYEAQVAAASREADSARGEAHEALAIANQWRAEALALREEYKRVVDASGYQLDPRDVELFTAKRQVEARRLQDELTKHHLSAQQKQAVDRQVSQMAADLSEKASSLSKKYPGLSPKDILNGYAAVAESGEDVSLDHVAEVLAQVKKVPARARADRQQLEANSSAPRTIKPNRGPPPKYGSDVAGMKAFLLATGQG